MSVLRRFPLPDESLALLRARIRRWVLVDPETGCWLWQGARIYNRCGTAYGRIGFRVPGEKNPRSWCAHVVSFMAFNGGRKTIGMVRAHVCHEPLCVNPRHIVECSQGENLEMSSEAGRLDRRAA